MNQYLLTLGLAILPAIGSYVGGLFAEFIPLSNRNVSLALHAAAGTVLSVVGVELMPQILEADPPWLILLAFVVGGCFFILIRKGLKLLENRLDKVKKQKTAWLLFIAVAVDLFSDGLMVGTGSTIAFGLALILALGHVMANMPEGLATIASFKQNETSGWLRQVLSASFVIPPAIGATIGFWGVRGQPDLLKFVLLAFTAGILTTLVVENMVPEATEKEKESYQETLSFVGGFALFALISIYWG